MMMRRLTGYWFACLILAGMVQCFPAWGAGPDYPHNIVNNVSCMDCHSFLNVFDPAAGGDTMCLNCHGEDATATPVLGHSSANSSTPGDQWAVECVTCHSPHFQRQYRAYGDASILVSGTSDPGGITPDALTMGGAGWIENSLAGMVLIPNLDHDSANYKILTNTADTITVSGPMDLSRITNGNTDFAVTYGKLIRSSIETPSSGAMAVRLFDATGIHSFADGDDTFDGICEVCHTQTSHFRNDGSGSDQLHMNFGGKAESNCVICHSHARGFTGFDHTEGGAVLPVTSCMACHDYYGPDPVGDVHGAQCGLCHVAPLGGGPLVEPYESNSPSGGDCTDCHGVFSVIHQNIDHTATPGSGPVAIFADRTHDDAAWAYGQPAPHFDIMVDCDLCHTTNLPVIHGNNCSTCHPTVYRPLGTWGGSCQQGGCHTVYHGDIAAAHDPFEDPYDPGNDCNRCHDQSWEVPQTNCLNCHASPSGGDSTPPVTTATIQDGNSFIGPVKIDFVLTDNGKVGVGTTIYRLDGGDELIGSSLVFAAPGLHTLEFWSIDQAGNVESPAAPISFTIVQDDIPPTTTSNAVAGGHYYQGTQISLSATDVSELGVETTHFRLIDRDQGTTVQSGIATMVYVPATSGVFNYTLEFWSKDWSGNEELPHKSVDFKVTSGYGTLRLIWGNSEVSGSPNPEDWADWFIYRGGSSGPLIASGGGGYPALGWDGVDDVVVPVSPTPYYVSIDWWDEYYGWADNTTFWPINVSVPGELIRINY